MTETTQFTIGASVSCTDGPCGEVIRVVVDPVAKAVVHLVVEPKHREGLGRLVPLDLVTVTDDGVSLSCTLAEFDELEHAEESHFLPGSHQAYASSEVFALPYYGLGLGNITPPVVTDTLPLGEVGVRKGESVHATDGQIGRVQGLVIEPASHHVTHVLLEEGHLWGKRAVAIPIRSVTRIGDNDGIQLNLSKEEVQDLPAIDLADPDLTT
jgi:sporulation protein YlmC with PRC-barrel domain